MQKTILNTLPKTILNTLWSGVALAGAALFVWFGIAYVLDRPWLPSTQTTVTTSPVILEAVKRVNKQIFIEHYESVDITRSEVPTGWLGWLGTLGVKQEFVVLLRGRVPAGFDLSQLTERDIWISTDGQRAQLTLPPPQIFEDNVSIDFTNSRVLSQSDRCPNLLCSSDIEAYQKDVLPEGQRRIIEASQQHDILKEAATEGQTYYEHLLKTFGYDEVRVIVRGYSS
jgi:hypothetical protein